MFVRYCVLFGNGRCVFFQGMFPFFFLLTDYMTTFIGTWNCTAGGWWTGGRWGSSSHFRPVPAIHHQVLGPSLLITRRVARFITLWSIGQSACIARRIVLFFRSTLVYFLIFFHCDGFVNDSVRANGASLAENKCFIDNPETVGFYSLIVFVETWPFVMSTMGLIRPFGKLFLPEAIID